MQVTYLPDRAGTVSAPVVSMLQDLASDLERHFLTALLVSGVLALVLVATVGLVWWRGKRWVRERGNGLRTNREPMLFSREEGPPAGGGRSSSDEGGGNRDEQPAARLVREAAVRAAGLRSAWDRAYGEARRSEVAPASAPPTEDLAALMSDLLREQQETNALLRELLSRIPRSTP
jgi:hypothetical protein